MSLPCEYKAKKCIANNSKKGNNFEGYIIPSMTAIFRRNSINEKGHSKTKEASTQVPDDEKDTDFRRSKYIKEL